MSFDDTTLVHPGTQAAHAGNAIFDTRLCEKGEIASTTWFSKIYGLSWKEVDRVKRAAHRIRLNGSVS